MGVVRCMGPGGPLRETLNVVLDAGERCCLIYGADLRHSGRSGSCLESLSSLWLFRSSSYYNNKGQFRATVETKQCFCFLLNFLFSGMCKSLAVGNGIVFVLGILTLKTA